jgi:hypothetical protein
MEPRGQRMRGVHPPHCRTANTAHPPIRGCAAGCAVGGANQVPQAHWLPPGPGGGVVRRQRRPATAPQDRTSLRACRDCHVIQRERPQPFLGMSRTRNRRPAGRSGPLTGPRGLSWRWSFPSVRAKKRTYANSGVPLRRPDSSVPAGHAPSWGQSAARTAADWPPYGGVERTGRADALRAIDSTACPRSWADLRSAPPPAAIQC